MSVILQDTLKSLCHQNGWCYAVFWKLKRRGRMLLTWEDGYYEFAKSSFASNDYSSIESLYEKFGTVGSSHDYDICRQELHCTQDRIGLAVAKMSYQVYSLGEGVVGHVAFTGKHQWVVNQNNCIDKTNSTGMLTDQMHECPTGWQNQFDCGIKTVAVVAVLPHGVVQLGSMQMIMEDVEFISHIQNVFGTLQNTPRAFLPDCLHEPLKGKNQGSVFPSFPEELTTAGYPYQMQTSNTNYFQDHLNTSNLKIQVPNILDGSGDHCSSSEMDKKIQAKPCLVSSQNISSPKEISNQHSKLQQEDENISSFSCAVAIGLGTKMEETDILEMETINQYQEILRINKSLADNQCAPFTGLGIRNKNLGVMEEHLQMSDTSSAVQYQSNNNMLKALHKMSTLNSNSYQVESKNERELSEITGQELLGEAIIAERTSNVDVLQQENILKPFSALQYAASQFESSPSLSVIPFINKSTGINTSPFPKMEMNVDSVYRYSTIYTDCIQNCAFDCEEKFRSSMTSHLSVVSPDLLDSVLLTSEPGRIEQQHWLEESSEKYEAVFSENGLVETLNYAEESFNDLELETCSQNLLAIRYDHCDPSEDAPSVCKVLKSVIRDQDNLQNAVSKSFKMDKAFQTLESALVTKMDTDAWDKNFSERKILELHCLPQLNGILSDSTSLSVATQYISPSGDADIEGGLSCETNSEHLLDAVVGNLYSRENYGADDKASNEMAASGLSTMGSLCSPSVRTNTCLVGQAAGLKQTDFIFSGPSQCMLNKGNLQNFCNFDNVRHVTQNHTVREKLTNDSPSITHLSSGIDDCESSRCEDSMISQWKTSSSRVNRKRARSSESGKPRPKDRQLIQDRVKELREIIPNGVKGSIDSLLERTIKHMIFLQTVTKHAENLNQSCKKKVCDKDNHILGSDFLKGGASWALELCGQTMGCPIIVEELIQRQQMIVKMICEEQGLFLEIADIIRGLGLTILKGSMEVCNQKIWSHFIVEANQDVHRMEVLWSLVQLFQPQNRSTCIQPTSLRSQDIDNDLQSYNLL